MEGPIKSSLGRRKLPQKNQEQRKIWHSLKTASLWVICFAQVLSEINPPYVIGRYRAGRALCVVFLTSKKCLWIVVLQGTCSHLLTTCNSFGFGRNTFFSFLINSGPVEWFCLGSVLADRHEQAGCCIYPLPGCLYTKLS